MSYETIRHLHIACAVITISLFTLRGVLSIAAVDWRRWLPLRWLPHLNDTILLGAAVWLAHASGQYPLQQPWLTAKVGALLLYIVLGRQALKPNLAVRPRLTWFIGALVAVTYIVLVAHARSALPWRA